MFHVCYIYPLCLHTYICNVYFVKSHQNNTKAAIYNYFFKCLYNWTCKALYFIMTIDPWSRSLCPKGQNGTIYFHVSMTIHVPHVSLSKNTSVPANLLPFWSFYVGAHGHPVSPLCHFNPATENMDCNTLILLQNILP